MAVLAPADEDPESRNPTAIATTMTTREIPMIATFIDGPAVSAPDTTSAPSSSFG